ncbi:MAG: polysaccharide biosynthesis protein [Desulfobacteraceae bacterium]|nr:polysaccharide biosynthesis protein [Desulfobacteraceae bacterium]MBC2752727.1 polysaccharide biosynthesis protein [Desulfobacteraceae bacterium]
MKNKLFLYRNLVVVMVVDVLIFSVALYSAHLVRFDFNIPRYFQSSFWRILPVVIFLKIILFYWFDLYRGMWRYTGLADLFNIIKAASLSSLTIIVVILYSTRLKDGIGFQSFSRSVFIIDWCFTIFLVSIFRLAVRLYYDYFEDLQSGRLSLGVFNLLLKKETGRKKLLIIGAGNCGEKIFREIKNNASLRYHVVGFIDDNPSKRGLKIHGIPVLGYLNEIESVIKRLKIQELLIAVPSASSADMRKIVEKCKKTGLAFKTIPGYGELIDGRVSINSIRDVAYRDLMRRETIHLEEDRIGAYLKNRRILVTGAGGSIGSELCRQISRFEPESIVLFERAESPLYEIELELKRLYPEIACYPVLGDILDDDLLRHTFKQFRPQAVFHAAAYKHVPMLEMQPWRAVENNIIGTSKVIAVAGEFMVERFVFVSTDKAVRPTNIMGTSKRVAELIVHCQKNQLNVTTKYMIVRFGNVFGSVGSVIPLFRKQIAQGGPVTVTHPEVTRYFMTIPEACQLILQAGVMGSGGEIFLLDMGTAIKIDDMARDLIRLSGFEPGVDIDIQYIGLRPGEKLYEELITDGEGILPTQHKKIMILSSESCNLEALSEQIGALSTLAKKYDAEGIRSQFVKMIPEYHPTANEDDQPPNTFLFK